MKRIISKQYLGDGSSCEALPPPPPSAPDLSPARSIAPPIPQCGPESSQKSSPLPPKCLPRSRFRSPPLWGRPSASKSPRRLAPLDREEVPETPPSRQGGSPPQSTARPRQAGRPPAIKVCNEFQLPAPPSPQPLLFKAASTPQILQCRVRLDPCQGLTLLPQPTLPDLASCPICTATPQGIDSHLSASSPKPTPVAWRPSHCHGTEFSAVAAERKAPDVPDKVGGCGEDGRWQIVRRRHWWRWDGRHNSLQQSKRPLI